MRIFDKKVKMPKDAIWLVPGLKVKRWFALSIMGSVLAFLLNIVRIGLIKVKLREQIL